MKFASRAGDKLEFAIQTWKIDLKDLVCADLGCSTGGFVDCELSHGAKKVYAVDTGYGVIDWKLRNDPRVVVMERQNALHVSFPELMDFISIDVSWTKQELILPKALSLVKKGGTIVSLLKPHYEANPAWLEKGRLKDEFVQTTIDSVVSVLRRLKVSVEGVVESPVLGEKGKNREFLLLVGG